MKKMNRKVPAWEWLVAAAGLVLILFVLTALVWEAVSGSDKRPVIELRVKETVPHGSGELLLIEVHNRGDQVASNLKVRGSVSIGANVIETREVTVGYVPRNSRKVIGLFFSQPTGGYNLRLEPVGFVEP